MNFSKLLRYLLLILFFQTLILFGEERKEITTIDSTLVERINNLLEESKIDSTLLVIERSLKSYKDGSSITDSTFNYLVETSSSLNRDDYSIDLLNERIKRGKDILESFLSLGDIYQNLENIDRSSEAYTTGLEEANTLQDSFLVNDKLGSLYLNFKQFDKALDYLNRNQKIAKSLNDTTYQGNTLLKLGVVYSKNGDYQYSLQQFEKAESLFKAIDDKQGIYSALNNIASIYSSLKDYDNALLYFNRSLEIEYEINNNLGIARSLNNIGVTYKNLKEYDNAIRYLIESATLKEEIGDSKGLVKTLIRIGDIYSSFEDYENALNFFEDAFIISDTIKDGLISMDLNYQLYKLYSRAGEFENGLNYYKTYTQLKDSIFSMEQRKNISNLKVVYETEKKEQQIDILNKENEIIELDNKKQKLIRNSSIAGLALAIVIAFLIFRVYINKKKAHRDLSIAHNKLIEANDIIKEKNENIMSSIRYAQRIQNAILPLLDKMQEEQFETSILFMPKDIVSGDFYWHSKVEQFYFIAAVDCTGHGVPGAFMSMIGNTLLNKIVNEKRIYVTSEILEQLNVEVKRALKQEGGESDTRDGMDISLCRIDLETNEVTYTGARRPLFIIDKGELTEIKGDRKSIGGIQKKEKFFSEKPVLVRDSSLLVLTSDGFSGQQNEDGKKFGSRELKEIIVDNADRSVNELNKILLDRLLDHKGDFEQNDDITVISIKFRNMKESFLEEFLKD